MRQLTILPTATAAQVLADYLLTLKIQTRLIQEPEGWTVWVCDEDRMPEARDVIAHFQQNPNDSRFLTAAQKADEVRRLQRRTEAEYDRRNRRFRRRMEGPPTRRATLFLIVTSVVLFLLTSYPHIVRNPMAQWLFIASYDFRGGMIRWDHLTDVTSGQVWRLVTPIFLHFGAWHLLFNMMWLYVLGSQIEARRGPWRLLLFVVFLAVASNLLQYYFGHLSRDGTEIIAHPSPVFGGMSGVVYGLFGYVLAKLYLEPDLGMTLAPSTVLWMLMWFVLCFIPAFQDLIGTRVANMAHAAGLMGGVFLGLVGYAWRHLRGG